MQNTIFVEVNIMNISVKYQLLHPYGFWWDDFFLFSFSFFVAMATNPIQLLEQNLCLVWDYSRSMSLTLFQDICNEIYFLISLYKSMETKLPYRRKHMSNGN